MARMTKKLIRAIWNSTSRCYTRALKEEYPEVFKDVSEEELDREDFDKNMQEELYTWELPRRSPTIHEKYLNNIKKLLDDAELSLIIEAHKKGKIKRDGTTVDAIMNELFERAAKKESNA